MWGVQIELRFSFQIKFQDIDDLCLNKLKYTKIQNFWFDGLLYSDEIYTHNNLDFHPKFSKTFDVFEAVFMQYLGWQRTVSSNLCTVLKTLASSAYLWNTIEMFRLYSDRNYTWIALILLSKWICKNPPSFARII